MMELKNTQFKRGRKRGKNKEWKLCKNKIAGKRLKCYLDKIFSSKDLHQKISYQIKNLSFYPKKVLKEEKIKSKVSSGKEII